MRFPSIFVVVLFSVVGTALAADPAPSPDFEQKVRPFLVAHCVACHGEKEPKAGLRLDNLAGSLANAELAETWGDVYFRVRDGEMPPAKQPRPPADETKAMLTWIATQVRSAADAREKYKSPIAVRRLNRHEYENTLRDLLDLPGLEVKEMLPVDSAVEGFDTVGDGLDISYVQMARYLETAEVALRQATSLGLVPARPTKRDLTFWPQDANDWVHRGKEGATIPLDLAGPHPIWDKVKGIIPRDVDPRKLPRFRAMGTCFHADPAGHLRLTTGDVKISEPGLYKVRISTYAFDWDKGKVLPAKEARPFALTTDTKLLGYFDAPPNDSAISEVTAWLEPDDFIHFNGMTLVHGHGSDNGAAGYAHTGVAVEWLKMEGPLNEQWPPQCRTMLFGDLPLVEWRDNGKARKPLRRTQHEKVYTPLSTEPLVDAEKLIKAFMNKACRRRIPDEEVKRYVQLAADKLAEGAPFEEAMLHAYQGILCSPHFLLIRTEPGRRDDAALASRLSYFLWSSTPSDHALRSAHSWFNRDILRDEVEKMLKDAKTERFIESFTGQWLKLRDINATQPDRGLYPEEELEADIAPYLIDSMVDETRAFFRKMLQEDLSVAVLIDSDFAMLNEPLAKLYGIKDVTGAKIREVKLPPDCHRGGVITQAAILKVSANGTTTSPVLRGTFVTRRLLGKQVAPPPPEITGIDPDVRGATTIREQLAKHRSVESCNGCHARLDPPGFALESFDVIGRWRDKYRVFNAGGGLNREGPVVDPSGETEEHVPFANIDDFRRTANADVEVLARNVATKLMIYALGRPLTTFDRFEVDAAVERARAKNFGLRTLVHEVIASRSFLGE